MLIVAAIVARYSRNAHIIPAKRCDLKTRLPMLATVSLRASVLAYRRMTLLKMIPPHRRRQMAYAGDILAMKRLGARLRTLRYWYRAKRASPV